MKNQSIGLYLSILATGIAIGWTLHTGLRVTQREEIWKARQQEVRDLQDMREQTMNWESTIHQLDQYVSASATGIQEILRNNFPGLRADVSLLSVEPAAHDWEVEQHRIRIDSVPSDAIGPLLAVIESQRPPWRMTSIQIEASEREHDQMRLVLGIEGIKRRE